jgi:hypothetical protein
MTTRAIPTASTGEWEPGGLAALELELRLLPSVRNVGFGPLDPSGHIAVTLVAERADPDLEATATKIARSYHATATVEVLDLSPGPAAPAGASPLLSVDRVALVRSAVDGGGRASVELAWRGASATGSGSGGALIGPARATLGALKGLGIEVDAGLASVSTGRNLSNSPVRVILRSDAEDGEFVGIALGSTAPESSARATLAAFNRYVAASELAGR